MTQGLVLRAVSAGRPIATLMKVVIQLASLFKIVMTREKKSDCDMRHTPRKHNNVQLARLGHEICVCVCVRVCCCYNVSRRVVYTFMKMVPFAWP